MQSEDRINQRLGRMIAKRRKAAGYTQEEVSEHLEIGKEAYSRIERGVTAASVAKLYALADQFHCGVDSFLVEGSRRPTDQTEHIDRMLTALSVADRQLIVQIVEKLANRLKGKSRKSHDDEEG